MTTLRELCGGKPSQAIKLMCRGLRNSLAHANEFKVDMSTFGTRHPSCLLRNDGDDGVDRCYGCAATCTLLELIDWQDVASFVPFISERSSRLQIDPLDLNEFEMAIDEFRLGSPRGLFNYFECEPPAGFYATIEEYAAEEGLTGEAASLIADDVTFEGTFPAPWTLDMKGWLDELPKVDEYAARLEAAGL
jgi:hypothetical protein